MECRLPCTYIFRNIKTSTHLINLWSKKMHNGHIGGAGKDNKKLKIIKLKVWHSFSYTKKSLLISYFWEVFLHVIYVLCKGRQKITSCCSINWTNFIHKFIYIKGKKNEICHYFNFLVKPRLKDKSSNPTKQQLYIVYD